MMGFMKCFEGYRHWQDNPLNKAGGHDAYYSGALEGGIESIGAQSSAPIKVVVTGAAGQIGYALLPMIANGDMFGPSQKVEIRGLDLDMPQVKSNLAGIKMEIEDGYYPLVTGVVFTSDNKVAFEDIDVVILLGAFPRKQGMERKDLMEKNITIFKTMGESIEKYAKKTVHTVCIGNPANTNGLICAKYAPSVPKEHFSALTRLDHNRARGQIAIAAGVTLADVTDVIIWGNHSSTQYPNYKMGKVGGRPVPEVLAQKKSWLEAEFIPLIQTRGAAIINARKASSALSAARAVTQHVRDWFLGSDLVVSMAVHTDGSEGYGIAPGIMYSFPVRCLGKWKYEVVRDVRLDDASKQALKTTELELVEERELALKIIG